MEWKSKFNDSTGGLTDCRDYCRPPQISSRPKQEEEVTISPFPQHKEQGFKVSKTSARWYLSYPCTKEVRDELMKRSGQSEKLELRERQAAAKLIQKIGDILEA